jgi:uncharacterized protein YdhG (YjbR/CyaY superfamily)
MEVHQAAPKSIDEYIAGFPIEIQERLTQIRMTIRKAAPEAKETIKYQMPTFTLKGNLISFAAYKKHIALYPTPEGDERFNLELSTYKTEKSTVRFPLDKPIPYDLISRIVKYRIEDNLQRAEAKEKRRKSHSKS